MRNPKNSHPFLFIQCYKEILSNWFFISWTRGARQEKLKERWFFDCFCFRCQDPTDCGKLCQWSYLKSMVMLIVPYLKYMMILFSIESWLNQHDDGTIRILWTVWAMSIEHWSLSIDHIRSVHKWPDLFFLSLWRPTPTCREKYYRKLYMQVNFETTLWKCVLSKNSCASQCEVHIVLHLLKFVRRMSHN